jgi:hypothetical protein
VSGLAAGKYPSDVQPLVTKLRDAYATGCAQNDALAKAKTSAQLAKVKISSTLPTEITEAKAALFVALGIQGP